MSVKWWQRCGGVGSGRAAAWCAIALALPAGLSAAELDAAAARQFADAAVARQLARTWIPGAVVAVVQGGQPIALRGYGVADSGRGNAVDPEATLFRIGSITKVMTAVAALRMSERGELDIDADINTYLRSIHVPESFPEPVTARALMRHQGGFETQIFHLAVSSEAQAFMSPTEMQREVVRLRPLTAPAIYDNLGFGVLGIALSDAARRPFGEVLARELFEPLGMRHAFVGLSALHQAQAASCHMPDASGRPRTCPQVIIRAFGQGAGDVSATGADMAQFMIGLIKPGRLLRPETFSRLMDFDSRRFNPKVEGLGLAIIEMTYAGRRGRGHRGEVNGFVSKFVLFPQIDAGIFISLNGSNGPSPLMRLSELGTVMGNRGVPSSLGPDEVIDGVLEDFARSFVPLPVETLAVAGGAESRNEIASTKLSGAYFRSDVTASLLGRLLAPLSAVRVQSTGPQTLSIMGAEYRRRAPLYYERSAQSPGPPSVAFGVDARGTPLASGSPFAVYPRQPWYAQAAWTLLPLPILMVMLLTSAGLLLPRRLAAERRTFAALFISTVILIGALLLELQFGHEFERADHPAFPPLAWRLLFPLALIGLLYGAYRACRVLFARRTGSVAPQGPVMKVYVAALALSAVLLVGLSLFWHIPQLALR